MAFCCTLLGYFVTSVNPTCFLFSLVLILPCIVHLKKNQNKQSFFLLTPDVQRACQRSAPGPDVEITCAEDETIELKSGFYGRKLTYSEVCYSAASAEDTSCELASSFDLINETCHGFSSCVIEPTNDFFGQNPCGATFKYVEVEYRCVGM